MKEKHNTTKKACEIARDYCGNELVHGMPHINRMLKNFGKLKKKNQSIYDTKPLVKKVLDAVEFSIVLHDIAKNMETSDKKHGIIAIEILEEAYPDFFRQTLNSEWIKYAIKGHTDGEMIKKCKIPDTSEKICLALLLALDNMDAIGKIGVYRDLNFFRDKFNWFPDENKIDESFLERLLKNYFRIGDNRLRLEEMKIRIEIKVLLDLYEELERQQEKYIFKLIKEKKLEIVDSEIAKVLTSSDFCNKI